MWRKIKQNLMYDLFSSSLMGRLLAWQPSSHCIWTTTSYGPSPEALSSAPSPTSPYPATHGAARASLLHCEGKGLGLILSWVNMYVCQWCKHKEHIVLVCYHYSLYCGGWENDLNHKACGVGQHLNNDVTSLCASFVNSQRLHKAAALDGMDVKQYIHWGHC